MRTEPTCVRTVIARTILQPKLEFGLWATLPMAKNAVGVLEKVNFLNLCYVLGLCAVYSKGSISYGALCSFLGWLPITERLWLQCRKAGHRRGVNFLTVPSHRGTQGTHARRRDQIASKDMPFDEIVILPTKEEAPEAHTTLYQARTATETLLYTDGSKKGAARDCRSTREMLVPRKQVFAWKNKHWPAEPRTKRPRVQMFQKAPVHPADQEKSAVAGRI